MRCKYFEERQDLFSREDGAFAFRHVGPWTECIPSDVLIALGFPSSLYFSHFIQVHAGNSDFAKLLLCYRIRASAVGTSRLFAVV